MPTILLIPLLLCLPGCIVVKSSQLQGLKDLMTDDSKELRPFEWELQWNQYKKRVYVVDMSPVFVFGNIYGDGITLEGYDLLEAESLGRFNYLWQFIEKNGFITAYESGEYRATYQCSEWAASALNMLSQSCKSTQGVEYTNTATLTDDGSVIELSYDLFGPNSPLVLKKI